MPSLIRSTPKFVTALAAIAVLLLPAIWNGFPLLEYDTGGYLARWFESSLAPSRSTTYGLFLAAGWPLDFWPIVILQSAAAVWIVGLMLRVYRFNAYPAGLLTITAALAAATSLPWLASELLTDIFAGLAVLALQALVCHGDRIAPLERAALFVFVAFAVSTHSATYAVLLALGIAAGLAWVWNRKLIPGTGLARAGGTLALGAAMLVAGNYVVAKEFAWTPGGYSILFARMLQDGIVTRYLNEHCPDPRLKLCPYRNELPLDADEFLWDNEIFNRLGRFSGLGEEMHMIVLESLRDYPGIQTEAALAAAAKQLVAVGTGEGIVTAMWHTDWALSHFTPSVTPAMQAAWQQQRDIDFTAVNAIDKPVAWFAMALIPLLIWLGLRSPAFADLGWLSITIALALFANAAVCGVISNPHDRYGSRMVWIAAFAVALAVWRMGALARARAASSTAEVLR